MIFKLPDITDRHMITQLKEGTFTYNGVQFGSLYSEVGDALGERDDKDMLCTEPGEFSCEYGIDDYSVLLSFSGNPEWKKSEYVLVMINYNFLDTFLEFDIQAIKELWGEPHSISTNQPNWDMDGQFLVNNHRYGYTSMHFNKQGRLFAISYYDDQLYERWKDE